MIYNVVTSVIALVEADSAEQAIAKLAERLDRAGFDQYEDPFAGHASDAFESEPLYDESELIR